ncbi:hypothetical protein IV203_007990 [Nitzschia inconspicua]|uniref:Uncharacterized protein n=1 Tax=Nitzschia inconspicua TaxID=303405 RepID=A0A9K3PLM7_9STRA|nr:hypothetical protein IV203_007990 [Nitzschia inconspicua]
MIHNIFANGAIISDINAKTRNPFQAKFAGKTTQEELSVADPNSPCLCLAIAWDQSCNNGNDAIPLNTRIISSYSDGNAAIHQIQQSSSGNVELSTSLEHCWPAHKMFNSPTEVWCCAFLSISNNDNMTYPTNIVATGGDEGCWKVWDLRSNLSRPIYHNTNEFDAGVTVLSPHPRQSNLLVVGSYDETIALYDVRYVSSSSSSSSPTSLFHSDAIGGGIWRCKWHPKDDNRLLIAAMHGGCRIVQFADHLVPPQGLKCDHDACSEIPIQFHSVFTEHKSMAYGCDWLVYPNDAIVEGKKDEVVEAAVSCSFYDQAMYLWSAPITDSI